MKVTNSLLLYIAEKASISAAFVYLILSQRKIYANSKTFEKYGVNRHVFYKALKELKEIGLIYFKYGVGKTYFIKKVVRIGLNSRIFYNEVSSDLTEWRTDYNGLLDNPSIYNLLNIYHSEELEALKNKEIDYIVLSPDL